MRIYLHDYAGHAFAADLARALARRGHTVRYGFSSTNLAPQGRLTPSDADPPGFSLDPVHTPPVDKRARSLAGFVARQRAERAYGRAAAARVAAFGPDAVLCGNTPVDAVGAVQHAADAADARFVNWLQDVLSVGARAVLRKKIPAVGDLIGRAYEAREGRLLRRADAVVAITDAFRPLLRRWAVPDGRVHVVENWAPLDDLPVRPQDNAWSRAHRLAGRPVALYSGTLGMKHDPARLARLAEAVGAAEADARVVVVSSGEGADWLAHEKARRGLDALVVLPFQPFEALPDVLAAASVLVAVLEPDASAVSVPSKVLAYLCAARPVVLSVPPDNLAARIVEREGAGVVVPPTAPGAFVREALALLADAPRQRQMGAAGRAYAERAFDVDAVAARFEAILGGRRA